MKNSFFKLFVGLVFLSATAANAQKQPAWSTSFDAPVLWQKVTPLGNLVVCTRDALIGVHQNTGDRMWQLDELGNLKEESYGLLPGTFFVEIGKQFRSMVLDPWEGRIVFDSRQLGFSTVLSKNVLLKAGGILVYGFEEKTKPGMGFFDIQTGEKRWSNDEIFGNGKKASSGLGGLIQAAKVMADQSEQEGGNAFELIEVDEQSFIIATHKGLYRVNSQTGDLIWNSELPRPKGAVSASNAYKLIPAPEGHHFYFAKSNYIMAYDIESGQQAWGDVTKISGIVNEIIAHEKGLIILPKIDLANTMFAPKVNLLNYQTGQGYWGKKGAGVKINGSVTGYYFTDKGLVLSMQKDDNVFLNILDIYTGTLRFPKSLKINGYLSYTEVTPSGLLYITNPDVNAHGEANIFDLGKGKARFSNSIRSGKPGSDERVASYNLLTAFVKDKVYVFSQKDKALYEIDKTAGSLKTLQENIKFQGKEKPSRIEVREQGIALISEQNVRMIGFSGNTVFDAYYAAPGQPALLKAMYGIASVHAALVSAQVEMMAAAATQAGYNARNDLERGIANEFSNEFGAYASDARAYSKMAMTAAKKRFKASAESSNFVFMMIKLDKEKTGVGKMFESATYGLIQVDKDSGNIIETIDMANEQEPSYQVDDISQSIFYRMNNREVVCYKF